MRKLSKVLLLGLFKKRERKTLDERMTIGVLTFEVASLMSKAVHLWHSLKEEQIAKLRDEVLLLEGVRKLVSNDDDFLLALALTETMDSVASLAHSVARLGKRCADPVLLRFEHVFADLILNDSDLYGLVNSERKMERKIKKMEGFVAAGANLYLEQEILAELEQGLRRMQGNSDTKLTGNSLLDFKQKIVWQRQAVKCLREVSIWNRTYQYTARLLATSLFTIVHRIKHVYGFQNNNADTFPKTLSRLSRSFSVDGVFQSSMKLSDRGFLNMFASGPIKKSGKKSVQNDRVVYSRLKGTLSLTPLRLSKPFKGCMVGDESSPVLERCIAIDGDINRQNHALGSSGDGKGGDESELLANVFNTNLLLAILKSRQKFLNAPPSTLGAAALALHYANVIIVIEKLAASPHLIGHDVRDDLYGMLPMSIRMTLRIRLKSYAKNLTSSVYDPDLAEEWRDAIGKILEWLAPLAHNMIKWQSDRNFEQQHLVSSNNVLLLQTLYYANQGKTEAAITELLVGLNYLWRYAKELNEKAMLECASSRNFDDCSDNKSMICRVGKTM